MRSQSDWTRVLAAVLIGAGVVMLGIQQFAWQFTGRMWPFVVIVPGVALFAIGASMRAAGKAFAMGGAVVTGIGLILLGQEFFHYYESWAYLWTLLPVFAGLALVFAGQRDGDEKDVARGRGLIVTGGVMFAVFTAAFEGLIFRGGLFAGGLVLPLILILAGVALLFRMPGTKSDGPAMTGGNGTSAGTPPAA